MALIEQGEYVVVMEEGSGLRVLARAERLDVASAAYMAALTRYRKENVDLRQRFPVVKRRQGAPKPEPAPDPALPDFDVIIRGSRSERRGTVMAKDEADAKLRAIDRFRLSAEEVKRLARPQAITTEKMPCMSRLTAIVPCIVCCSRRSDRATLDP